MSSLKQVNKRETEIENIRITFITTSAITIIAYIINRNYNHNFRNTQASIQSINRASKQKQCIYKNRNLKLNLI